MSAHGHATVWGIHFGAGHSHNGQEWYQQLKSWWAAHKVARHEAKLATLKARWDAKREAVRALHADAAPDLVVSAHMVSTATALCDLTL